MNMKRMRGRNNNRGGGGGGGGPIRHQSGNVPMNRNHVFDSIGPDLRIRGTSQQLFEKYLQLGRDATSSGDRVMAESYFQYAEHYFRILNAMNQAAQQGGQPNPQQGGYSNQNGGHNQHRRPETMADAEQDGDEDQPEEGAEPPAERQAVERPERAERQERPERHDRPERRERAERHTAEPAQEPRPIPIAAGAPDPS